MAPTSRPNEPVQHGLASGPGGGPEVLPAPAQGQTNTAPQVIGQMASAPSASPDVKALAAFVSSGTQ